MMNKQELLAWVQSLPEDAEALPFEITEIKEERDDWEFQSGVRGGVFPAVYEQKVRTEMVLRVRHTGTIQGEFQRDSFGNDRWANIRRIA